MTWTRHRAEGRESHCRCHSHFLRFSRHRPSPAASPLGDHARLQKRAVSPLTDSPLMPVAAGKAKPSPAKAHGHTETDVHLATPATLLGTVRGEQTCSQAVYSCNVIKKTVRHDNMRSKKDSKKLHRCRIYRTLPSREILPHTYLDRALDDVKSVPAGVNMAWHLHTIKAVSEGMCLCQLKPIGHAGYVPTML
ncbi:hypothetical protein O3P69_005681 [Scylla paramamosain]|uniref:Uncharacterized protein n=1 Tax=Scylla paramamosain TaxID=85552 RepID=A0AAW0UBS8_SCYPA